jgi:Secretion system C-terminal sorting domain/Putative serine esterase (DUF676)
MKIFIHLLFFVVATHALAQYSYKPSDYRTAADAVLVNLDKTLVSSKILYDRVFPSARLHEWTANDVSSMGHFIQAQKEIYDACYNTTNMLSPDEFEAMRYKSQQTKIIPIGVLLNTFQVLNFDAIELDANKKYRLKAGRTYSQAYSTRQNMVASLLTSRLNPGTYTFQLADWAVQSRYTGGVGISYVRVNFGDGIYRSISIGSTINIALTSGVKNIVFEATLSNGSLIYAKSTLTIASAILPTIAAAPVVAAAVAADYPRYDALSRIDSARIVADIAFQGYDESIASKGQGDVLTYYAAGRTQVRKPIIVLDGFDPTDERKARNLYEKRLTYINSNYNTSVLGDELRANNAQNGYDMLVLNFPIYEYGSTTPRTVCSKYDEYGQCLGTRSISLSAWRDGGADYIERNAMVLVKLIQSANQQLQASGSSEKIVIIGPSMGGLISRYALRYMEQNNMTHNCKLWVSFDSPHHGANIPIGMQLLLKYAGQGLGLAAAKKAIQDQLDSPAAKQMLIHHYQSYNAPNTINPIGAPNFRNRFYQALQTMGFPQAGCLRRVAIVNGSKNGTLQPFSNCTEALRVKGRLTNAGTVTCGLLSLIPGFSVLVPATCIASRDRLLEMKSYTAPANTDICAGFSSTSLLPSATAVNNVKGIRTGQSGLDILPGGTYDVYEEVAAQSRDKYWMYTVEAISYFRSPAFIPTVSSYALNNTNRNWGDNLSSINVATETPFAAIYAPTVNQEHVQLTQESVTFVRTQIDAANLGCNATNPCDFTITPDYTSVNLACGTSKTLYANCAGTGCSGISYTWSGNGVYSPYSTITVTPASTNGSYTYWASASKAGCTTKYTSETLNVSGCGGNVCDFNITSTVSNINPSCGATVTLNAPCTGTGCSGVSYTWSGNGFYSASQTANVAVPSTNGMYYYYASASKTGCTTKYSNTTVYVSCSSNPCDFNIVGSVSNANPSCGASITLNGVCSGSSCSGVSYTWSGNGFYKASQSATLTAPVSNGGYTYWMSADKAGCATKWGSATINVAGCARLATRQGVIEVAEETLLESENELYPNPTTGDLTVKFVLQQTSNVGIYLHDLIGQKLLHKEWPNQQGLFKQSFSIKQLPAGLYFTTIETKQRRWIQKIVLQK